MVIKAVNFFMIGKQKRKRKKEGQSRFFNPISSIFFNYLKFIFNFLYKKKYVLSR